jgi:hypothetical protein
MATNYLRNPSFEKGHRDKPVGQVPKDWEIFWYDVPNWVNPKEDAEFKMPEARVLPPDQLPEWDRRWFIRKGTHCVKIFKGWRCWYAAYVQFVDLTPGVYMFNARVFPDMVLSYGPKVFATAPKSAMIMLQAGHRNTNWIDVRPGMWSDRHLTFEVLPRDVSLTRKLLPGVPTVKTRIMLRLVGPNPYRNNCFFLDDLQLEKVAETSHALPRVEYERTYQLLAPHLTFDDVKGTMEDEWDKANTWGKSADDAGAFSDVLTANNVPLRGFTQDQVVEHIAFFNEHYPGTNAFPVPLKNGPIPPPTKKKRTLLGYHMQTEQGDWERVLAELAKAGVPMSIFKAVATGLEWATQVKEISPETLTIFRPWIAHQGEYLDNPDKWDAANKYLDRENILERVLEAGSWDFFESLNETYATGDWGRLRQITRKLLSRVPRLAMKVRGNNWDAIDFDENFCRALFERSDGRLRPIVGTAGVGNPEHHLVHRMIELAKMVVLYRGAFGPHSYNPGAMGYALEWLNDPQIQRDYHMRFLEWDKTFREAGVYPDYALTEMGIVFGEVVNGMPGGLNAGAGWKWPQCLNGDLSLYNQILLRLHDLYDEANVILGGRLLGGNIFTTYGFGWPYWKYNEEWETLLPHLIARGE